MSLLIFLFVVLPWVELYLLFRLHEMVGWWDTLGVILLTGVVGATLARWQGLDALHRIQNALRAGRVPTDELLDGVLIFAAGLLLITPGLLTDSVGFLLLVPPARSLVKRGVARWAGRHVRMATHVRVDVDGMNGRTCDPNVIDVAATPLDDDGD